MFFNYKVKILYRKISRKKWIGKKCELVLFYKVRSVTFGCARRLEWGR